MKKINILASIIRYYNIGYNFIRKTKATNFYEGKETKVVILYKTISNSVTIQYE